MRLWHILNILRPQLNKRSTKRPLRIYAVGDIHGRYDLLNQLLLRIKDDVKQRPVGRSKIVFLGDYIDRGPDPCATLSKVMRLVSSNWPNVIALLGNHEEMLLQVCAGREQFLSMWLKFGGLTTLTSFGLDHEQLLALGAEVAGKRVREALGPGVLDWLETLPLYHQSGKYFFCHAGIRPGIPLGLQSKRDLLWIRDDFLNGDLSGYTHTIVHGHSEQMEATIGEHRIGVDTAAYKTGKLCAVALDGERSWVVSTDS